MKKSGTILLVIVLLAVAGVSGYKLLTTLADYRAASEFYEESVQAFVKPRESATASEATGDAGAPERENAEHPAEEAGERGEAADAVHAGDEGEASLNSEKEEVGASEESADAQGAESAGRGAEVGSEAAKGGAPSASPAGESGVSGAPVKSDDGEMAISGGPDAEGAEENPGGAASAPGSGPVEGGAGGAAEAAGETAPVDQGEEAEGDGAVASVDAPEDGEFVLVLEETIAPQPPRVTEALPPLEVDFEGLRAVNEDVVGWIYCADTPINYPVLQGEDNQQYLHRLMDGGYSASGSIFLDSLCDPLFWSDNALLYGHHMKNGSMFAGLSKFVDQEYYEEHPRLWLLTPDGDYMIMPFAGFRTLPGDWVYYVDFATKAEKAAYIEKALALSELTGEIEPLVEERIVTLSTCDYTFRNARFVLLGTLIPVVDADAPGERIAVTEPEESAKAEEPED